MRRKDPSDPLRSLDLLPGSYRQRRRVQQLSRSWVILLMILVAVFVTTVAEAAWSRQRRAKRDAELAYAALPVRQLRNEVIGLQASNQRRERTCALVETARPDDNALQALAGIATASQQTGSDILVDQLHLRFHVEPPASAESVPEWSLPYLAIQARAANPESQAQWFNRLNQFDRLDQLMFQGADQSQGTPVRFVQDGWLHLQLTGIPLATRVLP